MGLPFHGKPFLGMKHEIVKGLGHLFYGRFLRIDEDTPGMSADDKPFGASFVRVNQLQGITELGGHGHAPGPEPPGRRWP